MSTPRIVSLAARVAASADGRPVDCVEAIDELLRDLHELRGRKVAENVQRHHQLMAELDARRGRRP